MTSPATVPSPISTGGGGEQFEEALGAYSLGFLLARATPPLLLDTSLTEVSFQTGYLGWRTDDLLLVGEVRPGEQRRLAVQAKRTFTVSAGDEDCIATIRAMWDDFTAPSRFDPGRDRLAVATLHGTATLLRDFRSLLDAARAASDSDDFRRRCETYLSQKSRAQYSAVAEILQEYVPGGPSADQLWAFLQHVHVLSFDFGTSTAQHEALVLSILAQVATKVDDPRAAAAETWRALLELSATGRQAALTYRRDRLPAELRARHAAIATSDSKAFSDLIEHGRTVRRGIKGVIGGAYEIERSSRVIEVLEGLDAQTVVVIAGAAGSGKSALAARAVATLEDDRPVLAFQAVELATAHINETLGRTQPRLNESALFAQLASHDQAVILVDGIERLLEHDVRDGFWHLLLAVKRTPGLRLLLTCRDYSLETVRSSLLVPAGLAHSVYPVPELSDEELDTVASNVPGLAPALSDVRLRAFLRTPYLLDMASRLTWTADALPATARAFRAKCWQELVRADQQPADGMPRRRELAFIDVARKRAAELRPFVAPSTTDHEALDALDRASLLERASPMRQLYAPAHDVLEDWAVLHWLDELADSAGDDPVAIATAMAEAVGGLPALRRGFRRWLGEQLESDAAAAVDLVLAAMQAESLPQYFRDDCLVAALSSDSAAAFVNGCRARVTAGDRALLRRIIQLLRVGCKALPAWLPAGGLPSQMLVPCGPGWHPVMALVADTPAESVQEALLFLGLVEDWSGAVTIWSPSPAGVDHAGRVLAQLLPRFTDSYGYQEPRKRILQTMLKIPRHVPGFLAMMEQARSPESKDRVARDLSELVATTFWSAFACRDMPDEVIALLRARLMMTHSGRDRWSHSSLDVDHCFGINERGVSEFFPASALQGPFHALLQHHPQKGVDFILELLNHAGEWYGEQRWPGHDLEPAARAVLDVPGVGKVEQWMNGRLYGLYRGMTVGPEVLKSALMALEASLLRRGKELGEDLERVLLDIVARSNNVMATAVVASVCTAVPLEQSGRAALALLSCPAVVIADRYRMGHDQMGHQGILEGLNPQHFPYEEERKKADELPHRRGDLEMLALRLQNTALRDEVWVLIDRHRSMLGDARDENSRLWRLALHRMDLRGYRIMDPPAGAAAEADDAGQLVYAGPGELEADLQEMVDESAASLATMNRYLRLKNAAYKLWRNPTGPEADEWRTFLEDAQVLAAEGEAPGSLYEGFAAAIAAVCLRDHRAEMGDEDRVWCVRQIEAELSREAESQDDLVRHARSFGGDDAAAATVALIIAELPGALGSDPISFLSSALTHAVDEVVDYTYAGAGAFLSPEHRTMLLRCAVAAAAEAKAAHSALEVERLRGEMAGFAAPPVRSAVRAAVSDSLRLDEGSLPAAINELDFDTWAGARAAVRIAKLFERRPELPEARSFFAKTAAWLAGMWHDERGAGRSRSRDYHTEAALSEHLARFVLRLPPHVAQEVCAPLIGLVPDDPRDLASFVQNLIGAADGSTDDSFWDVWQSLADAVVAAPWAARLASERPHDSSLLGPIFLGTWWKHGVTHWVRLDGHETRIPDLARRLPAAPATLNAFLRYLSTIGQRSLPQAFVWVHEIVSRGDAAKLLAHKDSAYYLETLLGRYVYAQPHRLKSEAALRRAVLALLDALVEAGSSAAYRMRDDFVTPPPPREDPVNNT